MILTDRFVLLHMPRTGGTWLHSLFLSLHPVPYPITGHTPTHVGYAALDPKYQGNPAIIVVRDPWSWYVSFYHHARKRLGNARCPAVAWASMPFTEAIRHINGCADVFDRLTSGVPEGKLHVARFVDLRSELLRVLKEVSSPVHQPLVEAIRSRPPVHGAQYKSVVSHYDAATREFVAARDARYIERFGFSFPS